MASFSQRPFEPSQEQHNTSPTNSYFNGSREALQGQLPLPGAPRGSDDSKKGFLGGLLGRKNSAEKKTTRTGDAPKKRGPKPDSKPAVNRRQELNRQAQRTHRERKESYLKALELEVIRLKDQHAEVVKEKNLVVAENRMIKNLLAVNNIPYHASPSLIDQLPQQPHTNGFAAAGSAPAQAYGLNYSGSQYNVSTNNGYPNISPATTTMSVNGLASQNDSLSAAPTPAYSPSDSSIQGGFVTPSNSNFGTSSTVHTYSPIEANSRSMLMPNVNRFGQPSPPAGVSMVSNNHAYDDGTNHRTTREIDSQMGALTDLYSAQPETTAGYLNNAGVYGAPGIDHDSVGVDFVLALEESCRDHATFMVQRAVNQNSSELSGHALMMTCPSHNTIVNSLDNKGMPVDKDARFAHEMPNLPTADLNAMMIASSNLELNGEVTPVMALKMIRDDKRYPIMTLAHFESLKDKLKTRSRCYGFGAVLEEFEVLDAIEAVMTGRYENYGGNPYQ